MVESVFAQVDANRNGVLELEEVLALLNSGLLSINKQPNATMAEAKSFIDSYDINHDHVISKKELFTLIKNILIRSSNWLISFLLLLLQYYFS